MAKKESLDVIINDMNRNPHHWRLDQFRAMHRNGMKIWIGNGFFGYHVEQPNYYEPTLREKWQLHKALRRLRAHIADYIANKRTPPKSPPVHKHYIQTSVLTLENSWHVCSNP